MVRARKTSQPKPLDTRASVRRAKDATLGKILYEKLLRAHMIVITCAREVITYAREVHMIKVFFFFTIMSP